MTSAYEKLRGEKMKRNREQLESLVQVDQKKKRTGASGKNQVKKTKMEKNQAPQRVSRRVKAKVNYAETLAIPYQDEEEGDRTVSKPSTSKRAAVSYSPPDAKSARPFTSALSTPDDSKVSRDKNGGIIFKDEPLFRPNLTPKQMIHAGIFGGCYFNPSGGKKGIKYPKGGIPIDYKEYPQEWFSQVPKHKYVSRRYVVATNKYQVKAGQDQTFWEEKGWIREQDPRGWFQWYTRFFLGRRSEDDQRQISRWKGK